MMIRLFMNLLVVCICVFVFKQKTAYDMRISDWSSDVCSSDLSQHRQQPGVGHTQQYAAPGAAESRPGGADAHRRGAGPPGGIQGGTQPAAAGDRKRVV